MPFLFDLFLVMLLCAFGLILLFYMNAQIFESIVCIYVYAYVLIWFVCEEKAVTVDLCLDAEKMQHRKDTKLFGFWCIFSIWGMRKLEPLLKCGYYSLQVSPFEVKWVFPYIGLRVYVSKKNV